MTQALIDAQVGADKLENPYITFWLQDGILCGRYAKDIHVSLEVAKSIVESRIYFSKGKSYPVMVDMTGVRSTTKEARRYLATIGATLVTAGALVTGSFLNRALGNLFLTIDKPAIPTKLFNSEEKAMKWLEQFL